MKTEHSSSLQDWKTKIQHKLLCFIDYIDITQTSYSVEWGYQSNIANCIRVATRPLMMISRWSWKFLIAGCGLGFAGKPKKQQQQNPTQAPQKTSQPHTATFHTSNSGAQCNGRHPFMGHETSQWSPSRTNHEGVRSKAEQVGEGWWARDQTAPSGWGERSACFVRPNKLATAIYQVWKWP